MSRDVGPTPELKVLQVTYGAVLLILHDMLRRGCDLVTVPILECGVANARIDDSTVVIDVSWVLAIVKDLIDRRLLTIQRSQHRSGVVGLSSTTLDEVDIRKAHLKISPAVLHAKVKPETAHYTNQNYGEQFFGHSSKFVDIHATPTTTPPPPPNHDEEDETSKGSNGPKTPPVLPDGPFPPNSIRWKGKQLDVAPQPFKLLKFMWNRPATRPAEESTVLDLLWGVNNDKTAEALKTPIFKANAILLECGVPWKIYRKNGFVTREE